MGVRESKAAVNAGKQERVQRRGNGRRRAVPKCGGAPLTASPFPRVDAQAASAVLSRVLDLVSVPPFHHHLCLCHPLTTPPPQVFNERVLDLLSGEEVHLFRVGAGEGADAWRQAHGLDANSK